MDVQNKPCEDYGLLPFSAWRLYGASMLVRAPSIEMRCKLAVIMCISGPNSNVIGSWGLKSGGESIMSGVVFVPQSSLWEAAAPSSVSIRLKHCAARAYLANVDIPEPYVEIPHFRIPALQNKSIPTSYVGMSCTSRRYLHSRHKIMWFGAQVRFPMVSTRTYLVVSQNRGTPI